MLVAVLSDTHIGSRALALPPGCWDYLRAADLIVHAGDLTTMAVLDDLRACGEVVAVHGNADEAAVRAALPAEVALELGGWRVVVVHHGGPRPGRLARLRRSYPAADAVIFGHSHTPLHETGEDGFHIFNPGSPTDRRREPRHTMGLMRVDEGGLELELVALD